MGNKHEVLDIHGSGAAPTLGACMEVSLEMRLSERFPVSGPRMERTSQVEKATSAKSGRWVGAAWLVQETVCNSEPMLRLCPYRDQPRGWRRKQGPEYQSSASRY